MFRGHFRHTIDPKGRLSIPAKFREQLGDGRAGELVIVPSGNALDAYPIERWQELEDKVNALPKFDKERREFQYSYLSLGLDVMLDPHGRIQIPQDYRARAGLMKDVLIVGMLDRFEVWDRQRWESFRREKGGPHEDLLDRMAAKGI